MAKGLFRISIGKISALQFSNGATPVNFSSILALCAKGNRSDFVRTDELRCSPVKNIFRLAGLVFNQLSNVVRLFCPIADELSRIVGGLFIVFAF
ncbi:MULTISPECIES: hypothetical protein [Vibrio]|uniref:hypothetical protein n=1 Tax=Vibrio TaxID=662 RepID=UPI001D049241|nr:MULTISPECIES: hypothetical protein [Vibrio]MCR9381250.1 hypothetical protein [Vibrio alginolyticus]MCR9431724.1 hypothetical protein [Vibrio alginolyticus]MCR9436430.1 hypothetical protein [Vibrio alginolyticus]MCS0197278.1 hypothetical protein [Vibrio alginolyticus]MCS0240598.1 hypothetical protein [Vibrio alginolyticus]